MRGVMKGDARSLDYCPYDRAIVDSSGSRSLSLPLSDGFGS